MLPFRLPELGQDRVQAQLVDRGAVDPADERARQPVDQGGAQAAPEERTDRHVVRAQVAGQDEVEAQASLLEGGEEPRLQERPQRRWQDQVKALWQRHQPLARPDVDRARLLGVDDLVAQAELVDQLQASRPIGHERVGPGLHQEAVVRSVWIFPPRRSDASTSSVGTPARPSS